MLYLIGLPFIILGITQSNTAFLAVGIALSLSFFAIDTQQKKKKKDKRLH